SMRKLNDIRTALRGGARAAGGICAPVLLVQRQRYGLVARARISSPSPASAARVPMDNLG
ncbi:MAG: hypothetical protein N3C63_02785, partial [Rhodocyclaceae bacterium]|nr:hypothetical protein [Rhodocyclaceae bacterium]